MCVSVLCMVAHRLRVCRCVRSLCCSVLTNIPSGSKPCPSCAKINPPWEVEDLAQSADCYTFWFFPDLQHTAQTLCAVYFEMQRHALEEFMINITYFPLWVLATAHVEPHRRLVSGAATLLLLFFISRSLLKEHNIEQDQWHSVCSLPFIFY